jgi:hypothetical protein
MKSLNWTDHANVTKQKTADLAEIYPKILRWVSEILAGGSEVRFLAGWSARLGDGASHNSSNRDALIEQRSKDLKGLVGQVRMFRLHQSLSDYELLGRAIPLCLGDDAWVSKKSADNPDLETTPPAAAAFMAAAGVKPVLKVLRVADYVAATTRLTDSARIRKELSHLLPDYAARVAVAEGPFEDDNGVSFHFDAICARWPPPEQSCGSCES